MCFNDFFEKSLIKKFLSFRIIFFCCFFGCLALLAGSHIIETFFYVLPCQLCLIQRALYYILGSIFLLGCLHAPKNIGRYLYCLSSLFFAILGLIVAGRQIWIQSMPVNLEQIPECIPGLDILLNNHPLFEVVKILFRGTSECFKIHFKILGLPLATWSFICFLGFSIVCCSVIFLHKKRKL